MPQRCVFFDRDGVINEPPAERYVTDPSALVLCEGIGGLLRAVHEAGWMAVVVTSQRCVGRGLVDLPRLRAIHEAMQEAAAAASGGHRFDAIYAFTGLPASEAWEKPSPAMVVQAARDHDLDLPGSVLLGDQDRDVAMGIGAGVGTTLRLRYAGHAVAVDADHTVETLAAARGVIEGCLRGAT